jgi:hypothetical protein
MLGFCTPHYQVETVLDLTPECLRDLGIDALLLDVDCTLKSYKTREAAPEVADWVRRLREAGIGVCLVSNGRAPRIRAFAQSLGVPFVAKALKPLPFGCRRAAFSLGSDGRRTAMVGDQLFADIMAGRLAGISTILVRPIRPEEEPWYTRLKRPLERWLLGRMAPQSVPDRSKQTAER